MLAFQPPFCRVPRFLKMPLPRHFTPSQEDGVATTEDAGAQQKQSSLPRRSPTSPCDVHPKRSIFGDMTNEQKELQNQEKEQGRSMKKTTTVQDIAKNNENSLKKSPGKAASEEAPPNFDNCAEEDAAKDKEKETALSMTSVVKTESAANLTYSGIMKVISSFNGQMLHPFSGGEYAMDIFVYMREREKRYFLLDYMNFQPNINRTMRTILVNWMVEVQGYFELNHETLYLAVKLLDYFFAKKIIQEEELQLLGSTALFIASKFEERCSPTAEELVYISAGAFKIEMLLLSEKRVLKALNYDINIPIAYRFLRQYSKCSHSNVETLTLARFICELTLLNYDFAQERASRLACACILLALKMKKLGGWNPVLECVSGYKAQELFPLVKKLNFMLTDQHNKQLSAVHKKYSHQVFFEVARIPPIDMLELEEELKP